MDNPIVKTLNELFGVKEAYRAPDALLKILFNKSEREPLFHELLELFNYDVSFDWFHDYFQEAQADRKNFKQDFTPNSLSQLLSRLIEPDEGNTLDVAAGTGGLTIGKWYEDRMKTSPFDYKPSNYFYQCEELSERALPFLLLNLMVRGMNAVVLSGDSLSRNVTGVFFIQNETDDHTQFSSLNVVPDSPEMREFLMIREYDAHYPIHVESEVIPKHLLNVVENIESTEKGGGVTK